MVCYVDAHIQGTNTLHLCGQPREANDECKLLHILEGMLFAMGGTQGKVSHPCAHVHAHLVCLHLQAMFQDLFVSHVGHASQDGMQGNLPTPILEAYLCGGEDG
jgi:hypothetical protein